MISCNINTKIGKELVESMKKQFNQLPEGVINQIVNYANTSITKAPNGKSESILFQQCKKLTDDEQLAAKMAAIAYSPSFIAKYGDWIHGKKSQYNQLVTNPDGTPKLFFAASNGKVYERYAEAIKAQMMSYFSKEEYAKNHEWVDTFISNTNWKYNPEYNNGINWKSVDGTYNYMFAIHQLKKTGVFDHMKPIQVGFSGITDNTIVRENENYKSIILSGQYEFSKIIQKDGFNFDDLIENIPLQRLSDFNERYSSKTPVGDNSRMGTYNINDNNEAVVRNDNTLKSFQNARTQKAKEFYNSLSKQYSNLIPIYDQNNTRFKSLVFFYAGLYTELKAKGISNIDVDSLVKKAVKLEQLSFNAAKQSKGIFNEIDQTVDSYFRRNPDSEIKMQQLLSEATNPSSAESILQSIIQTEPKYASIAEALVGKVGDIKIEYVENNMEVLINGKKKIVDGKYNTKTNTITISKKPFNNPSSLFLHELMHAVTSNSLRDPLYQERAQNIYEEALQLIKDKYGVKSLDELEEKDEALAHHLSSTDEFFSALWTDSDFIKELNSVGERSKRSLWDKIKDFLHTLFGIDNASKVYTDASDLLQEIIENHNKYNQTELQFYKDTLQDEFYDIIIQNLNEQKNQSKEKIPQFKFKWNRQQEEAIQNIVALHINDVQKRSRSIARIIGKAGTGKTTICPEIANRIKELYGKNKLNICVAAVANYAKNNLASKFDKDLHVEAKSVATLTGKDIVDYDPLGNAIWGSNPKKERQAAKNGQKIDLLFVDEASMLSDQIMDAIQAICPYATIVYIGDRRQIRPVDKVYTADPPFISRNVDYSIELLERVRQGEGAPILDYADVFGDVSGQAIPSEMDAVNMISSMIGKMAKPIEEITDNNGLYSINAISQEAVVDKLMPIINQAIEEGNPNKIGIITYYNSGGPATRQKYNLLVRYKILQSRGINVSLNPSDPNFVENIPYQQGEIVTLDEPYSKEGEGSIDNGTRIIIDGEGIESELHMPFVFKQYLYNSNPFKLIQYPGHYFDAGGNRQQVLLPVIAGSESDEHSDLRRFNNTIKTLFTYAKDNLSLKQMIAGFKGESAKISLNWALNVHKAQGQTYEVAYVDLNDFMHIYNQDYKKALNKEVSFTDVAARLSSEIYTAVTRASNITILGKNNYPDVQISNIVDKNAEINKNKKTIRDVIKEELMYPLERKAQPGQIEDIQPDELVQSSTTPTISVPAKLRKLYDFLKFATGSDSAYLNLNKPEGKKFAQNLLKQYFQRESELLHFKRTLGKVQMVNGSYDFASIFRGNPNLITTPITKAILEQLEAQYGPFQKIDEVIVKSAQAVIPTNYAETFHLGRRSLAEINPEFFAKINPHYYSKVEKTDLLVRTHTGNFNIAVVKSLNSQNMNNYGNPLKIQTDELGFRLDNDGNRMYWLPKEASVYDLKDRFENHHETIVLVAGQDFNLINSLNSIFRSIEDDIVSIQPFLNNISNVNDAQDVIKLADEYTNFSVEEPGQSSFLEFLGNTNEPISIKTIREQLDSYYKRNAKIYQKKLADTLYNSFVKACNITSSRIPTQALASFMDMQVVSFNPSGANDVFVTRWQLWLQGSDLDIDKSYMMGHSFGKNGLFHHWSPISDYSTETRRRISDELPVPNGFILISKQKKNDRQIEITFNNTQKILSDKIKTALTSKNGDEKFEAIKDILDILNLEKKFDIEPGLDQMKGFKTLIHILNKHNTHRITDEEAKNIAIDNIISVCRDPRNVQSAHSPIDAATSALKRLLKDLEAGNMGDEYDGFSIFQLQEDNQTGKKTVGVMANALKAFLTITQYYNNYYANNKNISFNDPQYFLNHLKLNGKDFYISTVGNARLESDQLKVLKEALLHYAKVPDEVLQTKNDISIILSAMVTLATDNAKELALAKLHASLNLASMHTYLLTMGIPFEDVVKFTAKSELFTALYNQTKSNAWFNDNGRVNNRVWNNLQEFAKNGAKYSKQDIIQLKNLYSWAQEFRKLTSLLGINQGMKNGIQKAIAFKMQFERMISDQYANLNIMGGKLSDILKSAQGRVINQTTLAPDFKNVDNIIKMHGLTPNQELRQFYINKIQRFIQKYGDISIGDKIDMNKYYTDNNYRDMCVDLYDIVKCSINVFDIINNMPNFFAMLKSLNETIQKTSRGAKGEFIFNKLVDMYNTYLVQNVEIPAYIDENVIKDAQSFCDDYFICDYLVNYVNNNYSFTYQINPSENKWVSKQVTFNTEDGLKKFQDTFKIMIAKLKRNYPSEFTKSLIQYERKDGKVLYKLNFNLDQLNKTMAGEQQLKYNQIVGGFNDIMDIKVADIFKLYKGNPDMTVGDMFYLYNLIFNLGQRGQNSFTPLLDKYITKNPKLVYNYLNTVLSFDLKKNKMIVNPNRLMYHLSKRYTLPETNPIIGGKEINVKNKILTNFDSVLEHEVLQNTYQKFISAYMSGRLQIEIDLNCN